MGPGFQGTRSGEEVERLGSVYCSSWSLAGGLGGENYSRRDWLGAAAQTSLWLINTNVCFSKSGASDSSLFTAGGVGEGLG